MTEHKDDIAFYKEIFDRERTRRKDLDGAISQPITVCSVLVALLYFLYSKTIITECSFLNHFLLAVIFLAFIGFLVCMFFLARSYNNLFTGFQYQELPSTRDIWEYQKGIAAFNAAREPQQRKNFEDYLLNNYVTCADNHIKLNDRRSLYLYHAKRAMIAALFLAIIGVILFIIKSQL